MYLGLFKNQMLISVYILCLFLVILIKSDFCDAKSIVDTYFVVAKRILKVLLINLFNKTIIGDEESLITSSFDTCLLYIHTFKQ